MKSTPFNPHTDLAPIPFSEDMCRAARAMKDRGLQWQPHAGCFVWDQERVIEVSSPFPQNIYFILNLGHFLKRFQSLEGMTQKLVWLPTWHQARQICTSIGVADSRILEMVQHSCLADRDDELLGLYGLILDHL